jgi:tetratricopeptide (TPR) repeat protein
VSRRPGLRTLPLLAALLLGFAARADDARLEQANALLEREADWPQAVALYRQLLAEDPGASEPRHQLARVLSWRGDYAESLGLFDQLLAAPAPPQEAAIERAEVLSWAGRSDEARAAFEAILAAHPDDARAARGLARVYRWAGQRTLARSWYRRALAAEDDAEARGELAALQAELQRSALASARYFHDSDRFTLWRSQAEAAVDVDFDTRLRFASGSLWASQGADKLPRPNLATDDHGFDATLAIERQLGVRVKGTLALGGRYWEHGSALPLARGGLEYTPDERTSLSIEVRHGDLLERSNSLASALRGYGDTSVRGSVWRQLADRWEGYAAAEGASITDGNALGLAEATVGYRPWLSREVTLGISTEAQHYTRHSDFYYSPDLDVEAMLTLAGRLPIRGPLAFTFDLGGGGGRSAELGQASWGPSYRLKAGLAWNRAGWSAALDAERAQSQRATLYTTTGVALSIGRSF